jgi:hypothetical protein
VDRSHRDRADGDLVTVLEAVVLVLGTGVLVHRDRDVVLQRQPAVPGDMVGVGVGLEYAHDSNSVLRRGGKVGLDRIRGVDQDGLAFVADEIGGATEVLVHELAEQHCPLTLAAPLAVFPKVTSGPREWAERPMRRRAARDTHVQGRGSVRRSSGS